MDANTSAIATEHWSVAQPEVASVMVEFAAMLGTAVRAPIASARKVDIAIRREVVDTTIRVVLTGDVRRTLGNLRIPAGHLDVSKSSPGQQEPITLGLDHLAALADRTLKRGTIDNRYMVVRY